MSLLAVPIARVTRRTSARWPTEWLSAPRVWIERLEARRVLSADGMEGCDVVEPDGDIEDLSVIYQTTIADPDDVTMVEITDVEDGVIVGEPEWDFPAPGEDDSFVDLPPGGPFTVDLPVEAGETTLRLRDDVSDYTLTIDADGIATAIRDDGTPIDDVWVGYDGSIFVEYEMLEAHIVVRPDTNDYGIAPGYVDESGYWDYVMDDLNADPLDDMIDYEDILSMTGGAANDRGNQPEEFAFDFNPFQSNEVERVLAQPLVGTIFATDDDVLPSRLKKQPGEDVLFID